MDVGAKAVNIPNLQVAGKELIEGVVIGDQFINRQEFGDVLRDAFRSNSWGNGVNALNEENRKNLENAIKRLDESGGKKSISLRLLDLKNIQQLMQEHLFKTDKTNGKWGGQIGLLATYNMNSGVETEVHYIGNIEDLKQDEKIIRRQRFLNSIETIKEAENELNNLNQLQQALKNHLDSFQNQLGDKTVIPDTHDSYSKIYGWNTNLFRAEHFGLPHDTGLSLSQMFWGKTDVTYGYAAEAFGAHLALIHPDILRSAKNLQLQANVIAEHGGGTDPQLLSLLQSTKGNIMSQAGGDIITIDSDGKIEFNIQSKGSAKGKYNFTITYRKMLNNLKLYLDTYNKFIENEQELTEADVDKVFNAFKASAWKPIQEKAIKKTANEIGNSK